MRLVTRSTCCGAVLALLMIPLVAGDGLGATTIGGEGDGILSLRYFSNTGDVYVEDQGWPYPSARSLYIQSAYGLLDRLVPNVPPGSAPIGGSPFIAGWTGGFNNFGDGWHVGQILPSEVPFPMLLDDLTIMYGREFGPSGYGDLIDGHGGLNSDGLVNGGFETGSLSGWSTDGHGASVESGGSEGNYSAHLSTYVGPYLVDSFDGWIEMEDWSSLEQHFSANAGDELVFDYEVYGWWGSMGSSNEAAIEVFDLTRGTTEFYLNVGSEFPDGWNSWATASHTFSEAGDYRITFSASAGISGSFMEGEELNAQTAIGIDNVRLIPIPEPSTLTLAALALLSLAFRARRRCR